MQYTNIKTICQVSGKILIIAIFSCFFLFTSFAKTVNSPLSLKEQAAQAMSDLVDSIIDIAKTGALAELKTGEFKYLYDINNPRSEDPVNILQRERIEKAVVTLVEISRDVIYSNIITACDAARIDIRACASTVTSRAEVGGIVANAVINRFDDARRAGGNQLDQLIAITEAYTTQQVAIDKFAVNIAQLETALNDLIVERELVDGYIQKTQTAIQTAGIFNLRIFVLGKLGFGLRDLQDMRAQIGSAVEDVRQTIHDLARIKSNIEQRKIKPFDIDRLRVEAGKDLSAVKKDTDNIKSILSRSTLAWLVGKYNELNPTAQIDLAAMQKKTDNRLQPLDTIIKSLDDPDMNDMIEKLKKALAIPGIDPTKDLIDHLKIKDLTLPKPSSVSGNPTGTIIGVDGVPPVNIPPIGNRPQGTAFSATDPFAVPPEEEIPPNAVLISILRKGRNIEAYLIYDKNGKLLGNGPTGPDGTKTIQNKKLGSKLYYIPPSEKNKPGVIKEIPR